ncbi:hypothetical protein ACFY64_39420 [Streptomyces collinus]|uniref:Uncharacterized protein n=1 Tax=Streptomyces sp. SID12501 TaxID=2706042 RepID=A0A6B3BZR0_9ACTN|nr:hypothetical protein [Streptomyces sp. SID12501]NEC89911.1 hypothetical protein [Streptomyces sp. SID12501]
MTGDGDLAAALDRLHAALLNAGDALGLYGQQRRSLLPPGHDEEPLELWYKCPMRICSGRPWPQPEPLLRCRISGHEMIRTRL